MHYTEELICCSDFDETDEYCPHCDNHYVIEAKVSQEESATNAQLIVRAGPELMDARIKQNAAALQDIMLEFEETA
jgi:hypothetical protein